jgi:hypothetical protein
VDNKVDAIRFMSGNREAGATQTLGENATTRLVVMMDGAEATTRAQFHVLQEDVLALIKEQV